ncbi:MAG: hypothetical protein ACMUIU_02750 [bacterium]
MPIEKYISRKVSGFKKDNDNIKEGNDKQSYILVNFAHIGLPVPY